MVSSRILKSVGRAGILWCLATAAMAELPAETLSVAQLPPPNEHRLYVADVTIQHIVDNRLHVIDGERFRYLGQFAAGYAGQATLSRDRKDLYLATTYFARLSRGERSDVVEVHDPATLSLIAEIPIPPRRAQALPYGPGFASCVRGAASSSGTGRNPAGSAGRQCRSDGASR